MASKVKNILYNLEIPPPLGVWPDIAARLGTEFDAAEIPVAQKMLDLAVPPPANAWENIAAQLPQQQTAPKESGRFISLPVRKALAAAAMLLLVLSAWYLLDKTNTGSLPATNKSTAKSTPGHKYRSTSSYETRAVDKDIDDQSFDESVSQKPLASLSTAERNMIANRYAKNNGAHRAAYLYYQPIATSYAGIDEDKTVEFTDENAPAVEAPLIRDANGQVILDKKLITSPDDCYITITSPNGEQTRISSKFLHIISTLNDDVEPQDYFDFMMQENSLWKIRFHEWKEKFMNQATPVPTATSFTDILDLKDLLMENQ
jgi:hypothetical protein